MSKLQVQPDGTYRITIPKEIVNGKGWQKGNEIGFAVVDDHNRPRDGDIFLRWNR